MPIRCLSESVAPSGLCCSGMPLTRGLRAWLPTVVPSGLSCRPEGASTHQPRAERSVVRRAASPWEIGFTKHQALKGPNNADMFQSLGEFGGRNTYLLARRGATGGLSASDACVRWALAGELLVAPVRYRKIHAICDTASFHDCRQMHGTWCPGAIGLSCTSCPCTIRRATRSSASGGTCMRQ